MSSPSARELAREAFMLGFMVSREGFNAECDYEHCAPDTLRPEHSGEADFRVHIESNEVFVRLCEMAVKRLLP